MPNVQGTYIRRAGSMTARIEGAAVRQARRAEMLEHEAGRQALYRRQELSANVEYEELEVARLKRDHGVIQVELDEAESYFAEHGIRQSRLGALRTAAADFPVVLAAAERRLQAARDALAALEKPPEPEPVPKPDVEKATRRGTRQ